jgi:hypothetical protein
MLWIPYLELNQEHFLPVCTKAIPIPKDDVFWTSDQWYNSINRNVQSTIPNGLEDLDPFEVLAAYCISNRLMLCTVKNEARYFVEQWYAALDDMLFQMEDGCHRLGYWRTSCGMSFLECYLQRYKPPQCYVEIQYGSRNNVGAPRSFVGWSYIHTYEQTSNRCMHLYQRNHAFLSVCCYLLNNDSGIHTLNTPEHFKEEIDCYKTLDNVPLNTTQIALGLLTTSLSTESANWLSQKMGIEPLKIDAFVRSDLFSDLTPYGKLDILKSTVSTVQLPF